MLRYSSNWMSLVVSADSGGNPKAENAAVTLVIQILIGWWDSNWMILMI